MAMGAGAGYLYCPMGRDKNITLQAFFNNFYGIKGQSRDISKGLLFYFFTFTIASSK